MKTNTKALMPRGAYRQEHDDHTGGGKTTNYWFWASGDRYFWDFGPCSRDGWAQYDTEQDAHYFGVWVNTGTRQVLTYAEGDISLVTCDSVDSLRAQLDRMAEFHGAPPPAFRVINQDGSRIDHFDDRPSVGGAS